MEERRAKYPMGSLSEIQAETFGEPGRRTFRLVLGAGQAHCSLWLEKEQLFQLGVYLQDAVDSLSEEDKGADSQRQACGAEVKIRAHDDLAQVSAENQESHQPGTQPDQRPGIAPSWELPCVTRN